MKDPFIEAMKQLARECREAPGRGDNINAMWVADTIQMALSKRPRPQQQRQPGHMMRCSATRNWIGCKECARLSRV